MLANTGWVFFRTRRRPMLEQGRFRKFLMPTATALVVGTGIILSGHSSTVQGSDPTRCPSGWASSRDFVTIPATGCSGCNYQRRKIAVDVPAAAQVMDIDQSLRHPKFCWKEVGTSNWECYHSDPWQGNHFRFDSTSHARQSPNGVKFREYSVVAQNESHDRPRDAQLVICYR